MTKSALQTCYGNQANPRTHKKIKIPLWWTFEILGELNQFRCPTVNICFFCINDVEDKLIDHLATDSH